VDDLDAPVFIYIHGGYWQDLERCISSYCVAPLYAAGNVVVVVGYDLTPKVEMNDIIAEIQTAVSTVLKWASERQCMSVVIGGHSAGSHLAAMLLHSSWCQNEPHFQLIRGLVHISGVFDLTPLVNTYVNEPLKLDSEKAKQMSPMFNLDLLKQSPKLKTIRHLVVVGENDSAEFKRQSKTYSQALDAADMAVDTEEIPSVDHFDIVEKLQDADYWLTRRIVQLLKC